MMKTHTKSRAHRLQPAARMAHRSKPVDTQHRTADRPSVVLYTASYATFDARHGVAVQTSVGVPRWPLGYEIAAKLDELMPRGLLDSSLDELAFEMAYRQRLDRFGVDRIRERFEQIATDTGGRPLVLLCFEPVGKYCHRHAFAAWWKQHTGQVIAEVPAGQLSLELGAES